jgi:DNA-directed RNA polymerase alpha subunit
MTQRNIDVMDIIVNKMVEGEKLSKALEYVYTKRKVAIPFNDEDFDVGLDTLKMTMRTTNALRAVGAYTINDVIEVHQRISLKNIRNLGRKSGIELLETILDYCWDRMDNNERTLFLIDTVERNSDNIREGIA